MSHNSDWRHLFKRLAADNHSGASDLAKGCALALIAYSEQEQPQSVQEIQYNLSQEGLKLMSSHPTMAGIVRILNDVFLALSEVETPRLGLDQIRRVSNEHIAWVEQASQLVIERAVESVPHTGTILTFSYSSAVASLLLKAKQQGHKHDVVCLESRPLNEGRELANFLGKNGIDTIVAVDAAALSLTANADMVIVGADSLTTGGVVNKIGTGLIAVGAHNSHVPTLVVSDSSKIWPAKLQLPPFASHNPDEVWHKAPSAVKVMNFYFEITAWPLITSIISERGVTDSDYIIRASERLEVHKSVVNLIRSLPV